MASYFVWGRFGWVEVDYTVLDGVTPTYMGRKHPDPQHWQDIRKLAWERDLARCVLDASHTYRIEVHHRTYDRWGRELLSDVYCLCRACHEKHHGIVRRAA